MTGKPRCPRCQGRITDTDPAERHGGRWFHHLCAREQMRQQATDDRLAHLQRFELTAKGRNALVAE